ncbi:MAG: hypothetical protein Athens101410_443 [Parcubacteria group bacterium Athens1014_10]|nr:MAG: hypothetical protein Athens101410_443 [Parcubacteria group bacterium Athens1014_10]TSD05248.1 MAG: hypothetical protein Athens071412_446 [Parcubacteria group bacterium Athens0714_12]
MPIRKSSVDEREKILNLVHRAEKEEASVPFMPAAKKRSNGFLKTLAIVAMLILVVFIIIYGVSKYTKTDFLKLGNLGKQTGETWQAVFLSNGQVYFGHITKRTKEEITLKDIYYLQVNKQIQPSEENQDIQPELSLVKLGNELHGPVDEMKINRFHILFTEGLKDDSRVVGAIKDYNTKK